MAKSASKKFPTGVIVLGVLVLLGLWLVGKYNGLISAEGEVQMTWAQVETEYQRRSDLVPNLVSTVQGAADFEEATLTEVTEARTNWLETTSDPNASLEEQMAASQTFDSAISRLLVSVEAYPTLTATEGFQTLQAQLEGTENRISVARMDYNASATDFNVRIRRFPTNIIASTFGFEEAPLFESSEGSENAPSVDFSF